MFYIWIVYKTNYEVWFSILALIFGILGFISVACLFAKDITSAHKEKKLITECLKLNDEYRDQIAEMRMKQHDLKNQFSVITGMLEREQMDNREIADFMKETGDKINEISLLLKMNNSAFEMLIHNKCKLAYEKGLEFRLKSYLAEIPTSLCQYDMVAIMGNLLDNAIESTMQGGEINVEIGEMCDFIYLSVINDGSMLSNDVSKVFAAGFSTKGENRGYGLSNVRSMVAKHGGNIELTVNEGKVEFRVYLPLTA
jgi:sensor histidine kinase regulating citrate/malate metabolism